MAYSNDANKPAVLIVEDDVKTAELIRLYLQREGYPVVVSHDGSEGLDLARKHRVGLVLLDIMLPGMDGLDVCRSLRQDMDVGIILVTARTDEADTLLGLDLGADDYVTKPFRPRELVARVRAVLRRRGVTEPDVPGELRFGDLTIDPRRHEIRIRGENVHATRKEFQLLSTMAREPGRAFSRLELMERSFGYNYEGLERTIDAHIRNLRKKIEPDTERPSYVETVYGLGYRFTERQP